MTAQDPVAAIPRYYEAIIKVNPTDDPARRARDIVDGLHYAAALLMDEYGWDADKITDILAGVIDAVQDEEASRADA